MSSVAGRVLLIPKGDYDASVTYNTLDVVLYEGDSYVAKATTTGNLPTNTTYWQPLTAVGDEVDDLKQTLSDVEGENVSDNEAYILRQGKGNMVDMALVGGSLAWNQLVQNGNFADTSGWTADANTSISASNNELTATITGSNKAVFYRTMASNSTHKYLISADVKSANSITESLMAIGNATESKKFFIPSTSYQNIASVVLGESSSNLVYFYLYGAVGNTFNIKNVNVFDLTALFGSSTIADYIYSLEQTTAGAGVAWFRKYFPNAYYAYVAESIESVNPSSRKVVGFNAFDEVLTLGDINGTTGADSTSSDYLRSNYISVLAGRDYYFRTNTTIRKWVYFYDAAKQYLGSDLRIIGNTNLIFTVPNNAKYIRFLINVSDYGASVYKNDICINISKTTGSPKNGDYEPYKGIFYPFDSSVQLRGIPKLVNNELSYDGDIYKADGTITRKYGIVDLGSLDWGKSTQEGHTRFGSSQVSTGYSSSGFMTDILSKYDVNAGNGPVGGNYIDDCSCGYINASGQLSIFIRDDTYSEYTAEQFKTAMSGVYMVYKLATPTTETAIPFQNPQSAFSDGIEEFVYDSGIAIPVGNNSVYQTSEIAPLVTEYAEGVNKQLTHNKIDWDSNAELGAHNLIKYPWPTIDKFPRGITFTDNGDGSITLNGTNDNTEPSEFYISRREGLTGNHIYLDAGTYILKCKNMPSSTYISVGHTKNGSYERIAQVEPGIDSSTFTLSARESLQILIGVVKGATINATLYPFITIESDNSMVWTPYAMTNQQLTEMVSPFGFEVLNLSSTSIATLLASANTKTFKVIAFYNAPTDAPSGTGNGFGMILLIKAAEDVGYARVIYMINGNYFMGQYDKTNNVIIWSKLTTT